MEGGLLLVATLVLFGLLGTTRNISQEEYNAGASKCAAANSELVVMNVGSFSTEIHCSNGGSFTSDAHTTGSVNNYIERYKREKGDTK